MTLLHTRSEAVFLALLFAAVTPAQSHKISGALAHGQASFGDVLEQRFTPDGSRLVYRANHATEGVVDLFSVPAGGSGGSASPVQLSAADPEVPISSVVEFQISPDSERVVFSGGTGASLLSAPVDGSAPTVELAPIHGPFLITPDGTQVVWQGGEGDLYVGPIKGSAPPTFLARGEDLGLVRQLGISPDGTRAVLANTFCPQPWECYEGLGEHSAGR